MEFGIFNAVSLLPQYREAHGGIGGARPHHG